MNQWVAKFNQQHAIGDVILCWPGAREGKPVPRTIVEPGAYIMGGHSAVVQVSGGGGCIALSHVADKSRLDDLTAEAFSQLAVEGASCA